MQMIDDRGKNRSKELYKLLIVIVIYGFNHSPISDHVLVFKLE